MLEIFQYDFMIRAFMAGLMIAVIAPLIGIFLVVRRYSLMADTLAHVSLLGTAIGFLTKIYPFFTAIIVSILAAVGIEKLRASKKIMGESVLALFLSGSLALAVVIFSIVKGINVNIGSYLFGSISTVSSLDLLFISGLGLLVFTSIGLLYKGFFLISLDEELARASGIPVNLLNIILVVLAGITITLSMRVVGILLIGALMVIPVLTAFQFRRSFILTLILSVVFSILAVTIGLFTSYYFDLASGGTIVVISLIIFLLTNILS